MQLVSEIWESFLVKLAASIVAPLIVAAMFLALRRVYRAFQALRVVEAALHAVKRQAHNGRETEGPGFWLKKPVIRPSNYADLQGNSIPILLIAATKGGVGKTSLAGSLAAHFALRWTQRRQKPDQDLPLRVLVELCAEVGDGVKG